MKIQAGQVLNNFSGVVTPRQCTNIVDLSKNCGSRPSLQKSASSQKNVPFTPFNVEFDEVNFSHSQFFEHIVQSGDGNSNGVRTPLHGRRPEAITTILIAIGQKQFGFAGLPTQSNRLKTYVLAAIEPKVFL